MDDRDVHRDDWTSLAERLTDLEHADAFSGIVRVVEGERVVFESCQGLADRASGTPITPATRFQTASLSKMFTAAILACVRDGHLATDARIVDILPAPRRPVTLDPAVTVHHLLSHTSGIGDYAEEDEGLPGYLEDYGALWRDLPVYRMERPDDFLPLYTDRPPVDTPGAAYRYSNAGYVLLGTVIEQVTGDVFPAAMQRLVFEPAGMTATAYLRMDEPHPDCATGYLAPEEPGGIRRGNIFSVPVIGGGDGGANTTAADIDRFLRAVHTGTLLGADLRDRMLAPHASISDDVTMGYGVEFRASGAFGKDGGDPGVETLCRFYPAHDASVVVLVNIDNAPADPWTLPFDAYR